MSESVLIAVVASGSALAGSVVGIIGQIGIARYQEWRERRKDEPRRKRLRAMLNDPRYEWRKLDTLRHVIGADADTAKRLLIEIDARASENGKDVWALLSRKPLGTEDQ